MLFRFKKLKLRRSLVPEGSFQLGSDDGAFDEKPMREIYLSAFEMSQTPVTNRDYALFLKKARKKPPQWWSDPLFCHPDQPVVGVNWHEAMEYCQWLSQQTRYEIRLPSEAEWEKAARGGLRAARYPWGNDISGSGLDQLRGPLKAPRKVRSGKPNGYGLFDMVFNIHQWCLDGYDPDFYAECADTNPRAPFNEELASARGASWRSECLVASCSERTRLAPYFRCDDFGFRWVRVF